MARILLLMPSSTYRAPDFMAAAGRLGAEVAVGTDQRQALGDPSQGKVIPLDFLHPEEAARQVAAFAGSFPLDAIVGVDDDTALLAATCSEALHLPTNPVASTQAARSKVLMRTRLAAAGLPTPAFRLIPLEDDPAEAASAASYPCVLKPTFLAASRGVIRANDPAEFIAAFRRLTALLRDPELRARGGEEAAHLLVEAYVPGPEFALEGLLVRGVLRVLALFDKPDPMEGPFFEETLYVTPSRIPEPDQERLARAAGRAAAALGLREGPVHAELRLAVPGPIVIELAARSIGGLCARTLRFGTGKSLEEVILRHALGMDVEPPERESAAAGVLMLPIPSAGILREIEGIQEALAVPGMERIDITVPRESRVVPLPEGDRYLGFAFARAATPDLVEAALREARERLAIRIEPSDG